MTKTLTEQWYDDTIDSSHHYYVRIKGKEEMGCGGIDFIDIIRPPLFRDQVDKLLQYNDPEVLALVPSYDEYKQLVSKTDELEKRLEVSEKEHYRTLEQLRIATAALKDMPEMSRAQRALKEMEGVK